jgi:peptide/nickel transport system substrate-binding protein
MRSRAALLAASLLSIAPATAQTVPSQTLNIAIDSDSDILDPTIARTYVSRIIFAGLCDKLLDIDEQLRIVPQLALSYEYETPTALILRLRPGVLFHDGTSMDAAAVVYSLTRHLTFAGSTRRAEISAMDRAEIIDPLTVRIVLKSPSASFVSQLTDRAGMIVSPKAAEAAGADFGLAPVCAGPFRFVERVAQDRVVADRFAGYWDARRIHFARVIYRPIPDSGIRLANLQAGAITLAQGLSASDVEIVKTDKRLAASVYPGLGYGAITFNVANGPRSRAPFGQSALIRKAFELSIDRNTLNQVVFNGLFPPVAQGMSPSNPLYNKALPPPARDVARAKALLAQAGAALPVQLTLTMVKNPDQLQVGEVIQSMAAEAGFEVKVEASEFASALAAETRGDFQATAIGWSGRVDPDGNLYNGLYSSGPLNASHYANKDVDGWLDAARLTTDPDARRELYARITARVAEDMPVMYLYNTAMIMGMSASLSGFRPVPDGLIRLQGMKLGE